MFLTPWLHSLTKRSTHNHRRRSTNVTPVVEKLEDRTLLSVSSVFIQATGTLVIATDTSDDVAVTTGLANEVLINGQNPST